MRTILLDWEGLEDVNDKPLPYSPQKAEELLNDPGLTAFRGAVIWAATVGIGREERVKERRREAA